MNKEPEYAVVIQLEPDPNENFVRGLPDYTEIRKPRPVGSGDKEVLRFNLYQDMQILGITKCKIFIGTKEFLLENPFGLKESDFGKEVKPKEGFGDPWWAYMHIDGTLHVKRYFSPQDTLEADESEFVDAWTGPFHAFGVEDATKIAIERFSKL
jgi:hypothetical protein